MRLRVGAWIDPLLIPLAEAEGEGEGEAVEEDGSETARLRLG